MSETPPDKIALNKARALCAQSEYSSGEVRKKLISWGLGTAEADSILNLLTRENFVNDTRYASEFVRDKFYNKKWGRLKIAAQLRAKSVEAEIIRSVLGGIDDNLYRNTIKELLADHRRFIKAKNRYDLKGKLLRFGLSKGYESYLLYDILNEDEE